MLYFKAAVAGMAAAVIAFILTPVIWFLLYVIYHTYRDEEMTIGFAPASAARWPALWLLALVVFASVFCGIIMGAHQKDIVEGFIHDEICRDIPHSRKNSYIPATASITLRRGQEILAGDWYACYLAIKDGKPCR